MSLWKAILFKIQQKNISLVAKDQAHEQCNKSLQMHGGAVGLALKPFLCSC